MSFKNDNGIYYITSDEITVFPCAYRTYGYDAESRIYTEGNLTKLYGGGANTYDSYIIGDDTAVFSAGHPLEFILHGYYFKIVYDTTVPKPCYAYINFDNEKAPTRIIPLTGTTTTENSSVDSTIDGTSYFIGMQFYTTNVPTTSGAYIQLLDASGNVCKSSLKPNIIHGSYEYQTVIGKYADTTYPSYLSVGNGTNTDYPVNIFNIAPEYTYKNSSNETVTVSEAITANAAMTINNTLYIDSIANFTTTGIALYQPVIIGKGTKTEAEADTTLVVTGDISGHGDLTATGDATFGDTTGGKATIGAATIESTVAAESTDMLLKLSAKKDGSYTVTIDPYASMTIDGALTINADTNAEVDETNGTVASIKTAGGVYIAKDLIVEGDIKSGGSSGTGTTLNGITSTGASNLKGDVTIGVADTDGKTTQAANLTQYGGTAVFNNTETDIYGSTLNIGKSDSDNTTLIHYGTLTQNGTTTITGTETITGNVIVKDDKEKYNVLDIANANAASSITANATTYYNDSTTINIGDKTDTEGININFNFNKGNGVCIIGSDTKKPLLEIGKDNKKDINTNADAVYFGNSSDYTIALNNNGTATFTGKITASGGIGLGDYGTITVGTSHVDRADIIASSFYNNSDTENASFTVDSNGNITGKKISVTDVVATSSITATGSSSCVQAGYCVTAPNFYNTINGTSSSFYATSDGTVKAKTLNVGSIKQTDTTTSSEIYTYFNGKTQITGYFYAPENAQPSGSRESDYVLTNVLDSAPVWSNLGVLKSVGGTLNMNIQDYDSSGTIDLSNYDNNSIYFAVITPTTSNTGDSLRVFHIDMITKDANGSLSREKLISHNYASSLNTKISDDGKYMFDGNGTSSTGHHNIYMYKLILK